MSLKRRLESQIYNFRYAFSTIHLPEWVTGMRTRVILTVVFVFVSGAYIIKTSSAAVSGYDIHTLENKVSGLQSDIQKLQTEVVTYDSIGNIQKRAGETNMVAVGEIKHLTPAGLAVALR